MRSLFENALWNHFVVNTDQGSVWMKLSSKAKMTITASGGSIGPFRYFALVDTTPSTPNKPLVGWWDYGSSITLADGESVTVDFSATNGALQIA